jgi:hypothetical protein
MKLRAAFSGVLTMVLLAGCAGSNLNRTIPALAGATRRSHVSDRSTVPFYTSAFKYNGESFAYTMVGGDPRTSPATTTVTAEIVPLALAFSNGVVLDATTVAQGVVRSPLFTPTSFADGKTQFGDAVMRAEFWKYASRHPAYHVLLSAAPVEPTVRLSVPAADGYTSTSKSGSPFGYLNFGWFVQTMQPQIIAQLHIPPSDLTIFVTAQTNVLEPSGYCCFRGYHAAFPVATSGGTQTWTTAWASVTRGSVEVLSHEVAEWLNDPFYNNQVPAWISPESGACGGSLLEVGDPLTKYVFKKGGFDLQDVAFYSWFTRQNPSIGFQGRYDLGAKLHGPAANCPA